MIAVIFLLVSFIFGWCFFSRILPSELQKDTVKIPLSIVIGIFISVWLTFIFNLFFSFSISIAFAIYLLSLSCFFITPFKKGHKNLLTISTNFFDYFLLGLTIIATTLLINQSLHFTGNDLLQIGANEWGDFDVHLPFIRSFAWGSNIPPSLPFFPNANSAYHFMFDYFGGILNFGGLPISYAFNIISIISFSSLLFSLYKFASYLFGNKIIGIFTILFFIFNSTLEFLEAYQKLLSHNPIDFLQKIIVNNQYLSAGPFTSDHVSIIWNMNVYLNQRHLLFGSALGIMFLIFLYQLINRRLNEKYYLLLGLFLGLTPFWSIYIFICLLIIVGVLSIFFIKSNPKILLIIPLAIIISLPQIIWLGHDVKNFIQFNPGFLTPHPLTIQGFITYWFYNLGLSFITIPIGFLLASKEQKKWFVAFFGIFIISNLIQFNSVMFNNHKLFNFWLILSNSFTAFLLWKILEKKQWWKWFIFSPIFILLIFSGIIDTFVIINEHFYTISDYQSNNTTQWVMQNTQKNSNFLVPNYVMYDPIRMAGRKLFVLDPRFAGEFGYDVLSRNMLIKQIYENSDLSVVRTLLLKNNITYVEIPTNNTSNFSINTKLFKTNFPTVLHTKDFDFVAIK